MFFFSQTFNIFEQDATVFGPEIIRTVYFTHPVETPNFKMDILEGADEIQLEMDLIGMVSEERTELHPYLDEQVVETCKILKP